ncbi:MAG TPA: recombination protein RecR [Chloroflexi bacterium]|nr:recombination protein RecR [Chloroflexota bacterium]
MTKAIPRSVTRLIDEFSRLPGIGPKTAARLTYHLLRAPDEQALALSEALRDLKATTRYCSVCYNITEEDPCPICSDEGRDRSLICVVEEPLDVIAIERTGTYRGLYHVLHGAINPVEGIGPDQLRIRELVARVERGSVHEVIMATNVGLEGDATAMYIHRLLKGKVRLTRLARGLPVGGDLEYADSVTLLGALEGRREMRDED